MSNNPLFPDAEAPPPKLLPVNEPAGRTQNPAVDLIRRKLVSLYSGEPDASQELHEAEASQPRSKHQQFIYSLGESGKGLAEIQAAWHDYYIGLPDHEKHEVWQEFYAANARISEYHKYVHEHAAEVAAGHIYSGPSVNEHSVYLLPGSNDWRNAQTIRGQIQRQVARRVKPAARQQLKSLAFGLSMGCLVIFIFLFGFFNQVIITPFIQPSRHVSNTPLIIAAGTPVGSASEVIIPKINVEIPVDYTQTSDDESVIESALNNGIVHYPSTVLPGQNGNAAFFGHSSNNIFNPGKYKFAFVLLHELVKGDTFYLNYQGVRYTYQVIDTKVVPPSDVSVLNDTEGQSATATLITCDPPGTSINRLAVTGQQISPDPVANTTPANSAAESISRPTELAGNGPSLWNRLWHWL